VITFASLRLAFSGLRATIEQLEGALPEYVDTTRNPTSTERDEHERDVLPIEVLRGTGLISRDFRDLTQWNRVKDYPMSTYGWPANKERGQSRGTLPWEKVTTIVLHTAGVAKGMHPDRWLGVPCHAAVADDGSIVLCHELNTFLYAAHAANTFSCSMEIAGDCTITTEQIVSGRALLEYIVAELRRRRPGPVYVMPHRFAHRSRTRDCGAPIWRELGEWGMSTLDLQLGPVVGSGRPLPF